MKKPTLSRRAFVQTLFAGACVAATTAVGLPSAQAAVVLKVATSASTGSPAHQAWMEAAAQIKKETGGQVTIQLLSGFAGNDQEIVKKLRSGALHAADLGGEGLGDLNNELYALQLPRLFQSNAQIDSVRNKIMPKAGQLLDEKGFVLAGLCHAGDRRFFTSVSTASLTELRLQKLGVLPGDATLRRFATGVSMAFSTMSMAEIVASLPTGMVKAVVLEPSVAVGWTVHNPLSFSVDASFSATWRGAVFSKTALAGLSADAKTIVLKVLKQRYDGLNGKLRTLSQTAREQMVEQGHSTIAWTSAELAALDAAAVSTREALAGKLFTKAFLAELDAHIAAAPQ